MRSFKRGISFVLSAAMLSSILTATACKKKETAKKIAGTDPWYTARRIELDPKFSPDKFDRVYAYEPWKYQDRYIMQYFTLNKIDYDKDLTSQSSMSSLMGIFDKDGNLQNVFDLEEITSKISTSSIEINVLSFNEGQQGIRIYFGRTGTTEIYSCEVDPDTGHLIGELKPFDFSALKLEEDDGKNMGTWDTGDHNQPDGSYEQAAYYVAYVKIIDGYEVLELAYGTGGKETIAVAKDGKVLYRVDFDKALGLGELKFVKDYFGGGNGTVLITGVGKSSVSANLDLATGKVTRLSAENAVSENKNISTGSDGKGYLTKATGIYEYDVTTGKEVQILDFDNCNVNRFESQKASVLSCEENKVILGYYEPVESEYALSATTIIYELEKAEKNPNEGKTVLSCASLSDSLTYFEGMALKSFNDQSSEYFAKLVLYDQGSASSTGDAAGDPDESERRTYSAKAMVSGSLAADIRSGNGPDVVLGAANSVDVLDSRYLLDLEEYMKGTNFDESAYYMNVIGSAKMDGKTFLIPTSYTITGIVTDGSSLDPDQKGFTYAQYGDFVSGQCIGKEPVTDEVSRMHFLNLCIERNYSKWIKENKMDFSREEFRDLTGFFKDSIPEGVSEAPTADDIMKEAYGLAPDPKEAFFLEDIDSLAKLAHINCYGDNLKILGLPSEDGTGPSARITTSFSITKDTGAKEGAFALLDFMLSEEIQKEVKDSIPVNRAAVASKVEKEKEYNQKAYSSCFEVPYALVSEENFREGSIFDPKSKLPETFLQTLEEVDTILLSDNSVLMIVSEEIPAYLLGQKDIETVIATINNRTQTVFSER